MSLCDEGCTVQATTELIEGPRKAGSVLPLAQGEQTRRMVHRADAACMSKIAPVVPRCRAQKTSIEMEAGEATVEVGNRAEQSLMDLEIEVDLVGSAAAPGGMRPVAVVEEECSVPRSRRGIVPSSGRGLRSSAGRPPPARCWRRPQSSRGRAIRRG